MSLIVQEFTTGPFFQHPLVVFDEQSREGFFVDLGFDDGQIEGFVTDAQLKMIGIYNTHAHVDHVSATKYFQEKYSSLPFYIGVRESVVLDHAPISASHYGFPYHGNPEVSGELKEGDIIKVGSYSFTVIETPGHTPGGVCFYCEQAKVLLAGDTLFAGSIGRTDLPGGDYATIMRSLEKLKKLPEDTTVYCGHGDTTTIGQECKSNPFLSE